MKIRHLIATAVLMVFSSAVWAFHCPSDMKKIDEALAKKPKLSEAQMSEVKKYRAEGETFHKAGNHQSAVETLSKAMVILGVK